MGLGASTANIFAKAGAKVVIADFNQEEGLKQAKKINKAGGDAFFVKVDVANEKEVEAMVSETVKKYGRLDIAVNNAARTPDDKPLADLDVEQFDGVIAVDRSEERRVGKECRL